MIDPTAFLLGMLTHDFLTRSLKKSQLTNVMLAIIFGMVLVDILVRAGAFSAIMQWWSAFIGS